MIPYFEVRPLAIGPVRIHVFGLLLGVAIAWAAHLILRRADRAGLGRLSMARLGVWMLAGGFVGAHLAEIILPNISAFVANPWIVLQSGRGIRSLGGLGGGLLAAIVYGISHRIPAIRLLEYLDVIAYALPSAWMFGRLGCFLVHDHRGLPSASWLAVRFPEGSRWDLGLVEFLFLIVLATAFALLDRRQRTPGFYFGLYGVSYGLFRVWLDTLHIQPLRFFGGATAAIIGLAGWWIAWNNDPATSGLDTRRRPTRPLCQTTGPAAASSKSS